ncbi:ATP-binding protein [Streptomyces sp. NPDC001493]
MSTTVPGAANLPEPHAWKRDFFVETRFDADPARLQGLRRVARSLLESRDASQECVDSVLLIVSELITNAIIHGQGPVCMRLTLMGGDHLFIEAAGENPVHAQVLTPPHSSESGRGLLLVESLSDLWGISADGMTTWATFRLPSAQARS